MVELPPHGHVSKHAADVAPARIQHGLRLLEEAGFHVLSIMAGQGLVELAAALQADLAAIGCPIDVYPATSTHASDIAAAVAAEKRLLQPPKAPKPSRRPATDPLVPRRVAANGPERPSRLTFPRPAPNRQLAAGAVSQGQRYTASEKRAGASTAGAEEEQTAESKADTGRGDAGLLAATDLRAADGGGGGGGVLRDDRGSGDVGCGEVPNDLGGAAVVGVVRDPAKAPGETSGGGRRRRRRRAAATEKDAAVKATVAELAADASTLAQGAAARAESTAERAKPPAAGALPAPTFGFAAAAGAVETEHNKVALAPTDAALIAEGSSPPAQPARSSTEAMREGEAGADSQEQGVLTHLKRCERFRPPHAGDGLQRLARGGTTRRVSPTWFQKARSGRGAAVWPFAPASSAAPGNVLVFLLRAARRRAAIGVGSSRSSRESNPFKGGSDVSQDRINQTGWKTGRKYRFYISCSGNEAGICTCTCIFNSCGLSARVVYERGYGFSLKK